jgi:hypothetical protein
MWRKQPDVHSTDRTRCPASNGEALARSASTGAILRNSGDVVRKAYYYIFI